MSRLSGTRSAFSATAVFIALVLSYGCSHEVARSLNPRIAVIAGREPGLRTCGALWNMGEVCDTLATVEPGRLYRYGLVILGRECLADLDSTARRQAWAALVEYAHAGGSLLIFGLNPDGYQEDYLPAPVRFATDDPSGWGNYDFSEEIADPEHPVFRHPNHLSYLAGLEEYSRIVFTAPGWRILLSKDSLHPSQDASEARTENNVGSIFEMDWGDGNILVCQPVLELYYAGGAGISVYPLQNGIRLFENLVEYSRRNAAPSALPSISVAAMPAMAGPGESVRFEVEQEEGSEALSLEWDFGDGTSGAGGAVSHAYAEPGRYLVRVKATDTRTAVDRATCVVQILPRRCMRWGDYLAELMTRNYYPDPGKPGVNYRTAVFMDGLLDVYERNRDPELLKFIDGFFHKRLLDRWSERPYKGDLKPDHNFVDIYSLMSPAWRMYGLTGKSEYLSMCREVWMQSLKVDSSLPAGALWAPWSWKGKEAIVDFAYFGAELRADYHRATGDMAVVEETVSQMLLFDKTFRDPKDDLYFQAISLDSLAHYYSPDRPGGRNDSKWGRANGWMALAWTELLEVLPQDHPRRAEVVLAVRRFFGGVVRWQNPDSGLWALITDRPDYPGMWMETTSTGMFVYAMTRLVELGVLPERPFLDSAQRGYSGLQQRIELGAQGVPYLSDGCEGTLPRVNIERWISAHRHDNDFHALGPYLRAEEAIWRVRPPQVAVIGSLRIEGSMLGRELSRAGVYFYQMPDLYTTCDLDRFRAIVVDRAAYDRNDSDMRAYFGKLIDFTQKGGTLILLPQEHDSELAALLPPGLRFETASDSGRRAVHGGEWRERQSGEIRFLEAPSGKGRVIYCEESIPGEILL